MWIVIPSTCCPSAPEPGDSISASEWRCRLLERSAMSRSKPMPAKSWLRAWKRGGWIRRLFGRICEPSTARHGVASWISSLADTPVSLSAPPANDSGQMTLAISGLTSPVSSASSAPPLASSKTCQGTCRSGCATCDANWKEWVIALRRRSSERRKSARRIDENASSSWPTPSTANAVQGAGSNRGDGSLDLVSTVAQWATPEVSRATYQRAHGKTYPLLPLQAALWETPRVGGCLIMASPGEVTRKSPSLGAQAEILVNGHPAPRTGKAGGTGLVLNPRFVEMLMDWPIGWTDCGSVETASSDDKQLTPSAA